MGSGFLSVTWYTGKRNVARKRISPINCQSNLVTQKIPLPRFYDLPPVSSFVHLRLNFRPAPKKARPSSSLESVFCRTFSAPPQSNLPLFDNDEENANIIALNSYRFAPLGELHKNPDKTSFDDEREREK